MAASASKARSGFHDFLIRELAVLSLRLGEAYEEDVASRLAQVQSGRPEEAEDDDDDDDDDDEQLRRSRALFKWSKGAEDELGPPLPFKVLPLRFPSLWRTRRTVRTLTGAGIPVDLSVECEDVDYKEDGHSTAMGSSVPQHFAFQRPPRTAAAARLDAELAAAQLGAEPDAATSAAGPFVPQSSAEPAGEEPGGASPEAGGAGGPGAAGGTGGRPPGSAAEGAAAAAGASAEADGVGGPAAEAAGTGPAPAGAGGGAAGEARAAAEAAGAEGEAAEEAEAAGAGAEAGAEATAGAEAAIAGGEAAEAAGAGGQAVEEAGAGAEAAGDAEEAAGAAKGPVEAAGARGAAAEVARAGGVATRARGTVTEAAGASSEAHGPGCWRDQAVGLRAEAGEESEDQPDTAQSRGRESATGPARLGVAPAAAGPCAASSSGGAASAPGAASSSGGGGASGASGGRPPEEHKKQRLEELGADMPAELMQKMENPRSLDSRRTAYSRRKLAEAAKIVRARAEAAHPTPEQKRLEPRMVAKFQVVLACIDSSHDADTEFIRLLEGHSEIGHTAHFLFFSVLSSTMRDQTDDPGVLEARFQAFIDDAVQKSAQLQSVSHFSVSQGTFWRFKMQQHARRLAAALAGGAPTTLAVGHFVDRVLQNTLPAGKGVALCETAWQHEGEGTLGLMSDLYPSMKVLHVVSDEDEQRGAPEPDPRVAEGHRRAREWGEAHPERYAQVRCTPDLRAAEWQVPALLRFLGLTDQSDSMIRLYRRTPPLLRIAESCQARAS